MVRCAWTSRFQTSTGIFDVDDDACETTRASSRSGCSVDAVVPCTVYLNKTQSQMERKCLRPAPAPRRAGRRHRPVRALPPAGAAPRAPPGGPAPEATRASGRRGRRSAAQPLRKHKSDARRVGRAPLAPHRAPGARAVRLICFSGGRTRPATICQAPRRLATRDAGGDKTPRRGPSPSSASWRGRVGVARAARRDRTARARRSRSRRSRRPP